MSYFFQLVVSGIVVGSIYALSALGFVLIYKSSRVLNLAHGQIIAAGAFIAYALTAWVGLPIFVSFAVSMVITFFLAMSVERIFLRRLIGEPIISVIMVTIGLSIFFQAIMNWMFGVFVQPFPRIFETRAVDIFGLNVQPAYLMSLVISVFIMAGFAWFFKYSRLGLAMRATAFDQQVAQSLGISIKRMFAMSWAISAMVSALAGVVVGVVSGVSAALSFFGIKVFPAVILGGLDSIIGAVVGGLIIGVLENLAEYVDGQWLHLGNLYTIAPFYVLIVILMIKPYGLFGTETIERV
jgi:branched-chain amino acid transport system permease protein